jgi:hypothetical protein
MHAEYWQQIYCAKLGDSLKNYVPALSYAVLVMHRGLQDLVPSATAAASNPGRVTSHRHAAIATSYAALRQCQR